jgi:hypothetical protein
MSEKLAYQAIRAEDFGDLYLARDRWRGALERATEDEKLLSRLASHKAVELAEKTKEETPEMEREKQLAFVKQRLEEALQLKSQDSAAHPGDVRKADLLLEDISKLYKDHSDESLLKLAKDAANIQKIEPEKDKKP